MNRAELSPSTELPTDWRFDMAKKALKKKVQAKGSSGKLTDQVVDSARDIWLAGLGAFSMAQTESGKLVNQGSKLVEQGNKLFDKLVEEGSKIEKNTRKDVEGTVVNIRGGVESKVDLVRKQATDNIDKLENLFEERVARVLGRLGVPTADDVNKLSARVQKLSEQVALLAERSKAKPAAKKAVRKPAAKKTAVKPVASKAAADKAA
jgi:poly(hydroxyalkanoate) granule-associated protein